MSRCINSTRRKLKDQRNVKYSRKLSAEYNFNWQRNLCCCNSPANEYNLLFFLSPSQKLCIIFHLARGLHLDPVQFLSHPPSPLIHSLFMFYFNFPHGKIIHFAFQSFSLDLKYAILSKERALGGKEK